MTPLTPDRGPAEGSADTVGEVDGLRREVAHLRAAMASRAIIEQAKGVLMVRYRCTAESAFAILTRWSQDRNVKVRELAQVVLAVALADRDGAASAGAPELAVWVQRQLNSSHVSS